MSGLSIGAMVFDSQVDYEPSGIGCLLVERTLREWPILSRSLGAGWPTFVFCSLHSEKAAPVFADFRRLGIRADGSRRF
jgi:hypothetical protein